MTILVTGASGNTGRQVVDRLVAAGRPVRAMTRRPSAAPPRTGVETVEGDFTRPETWQAVLAGVEQVYLFPFVEVDSEPGTGFVDLAVRAGVRRFVVHSAAAAAFDSDDAPDDPDISALRRHLAEERLAHRAVERLVEASGAQWTHIRPGLLAVGALDWAGRIRDERVVRAPYAAAAFPWVHEADIADVAVAALLGDAHVGAAYTLTGPAKVSRAEQVAAIGAAIGTPVGFEELTPEQARTQWLDDGYDRQTAEWLIELLAAAVEGPDLLPPTDTYQRVTGRPPRTFAQWALDHATDFRPPVRTGEAG
ncbi:NAD(P)H-binding protein [Micromonospora sp. NPDC004704]